MSWSRPFALVGAAAVAVTSACSSADPPAQPEGRIVTSLSEIAGSWDIVRLGDYEPTRLHGGIRAAYVNVRKDGLNYKIECNHSGNTARIDELGVLHDTAHPRGMRIMTLRECPPDEAQREGQLFWFFATSPKVRWAEGGRVLMDNGEVSLLLERPATRRLANAPSPDELHDRWVPTTVHHVDPDGGQSGAGFIGDPGVVTIGPGILTWSACPAAPVRFRYSSDFRLVPIGEPPRCDISGKYVGSERDAPARLARLLTASLAVERTAEGGIALFTDDGEVVALRREADVIAEAQAARQPSPAGMPTPPPPPPRPLPGTTVPPLSPR